MSSKRITKSYDQEFKAQAVKLAQEIGGHKAADELGVPSGTIYAWIKAFREGRLEAKEAVHTPENDIRLKVYAVSNGGFIEGCQNRPLMQVLENFCNRCNFQWCGGVMLNVMRIMFFVYAGLFILNTVTSGLTSALPIFAEQLVVVLFFSLGAFFYCLRMGIAVNKGATCGVKFTRILLLSFLFILAADIFFVIISIF